jgi:hypothetical protein
LNIVGKQVIGNWSLACFGKRYPVELVFNLTSDPGVFTEHNKAGFDVPNMVVATGPLVQSDSGTSQYEWVVEFQCATKLGHVDFIGINWYTKDQQVSPETIAELEEAARRRGLGPYMDDGFKVRNMSQVNCPP